MVQRRVGALLIEGDALFTLRNKQLVALTVRHAIPAIDHDRAFTDAGGLMSYGSSLTDSFVRSASTPAAFSKETNRPTSRSNSPPKSSW